MNETALTISESEVFPSFWGNGRRSTPFTKKPPTPEATLTPRKVGVLSSLDKMGARAVSL